MENRKAITMLEIDVLKLKGIGGKSKEFKIREIKGKLRGFNTQNITIEG